MHEKKIQREMFEARQDLEENLDKLLHKTRETISLRARLENMIGSRALASVGVAALAGGAFALLFHRSHS